MADLNRSRISYSPQEVYEFLTEFHPESGFYERYRSEEHEAGYDDPVEELKKIYGRVEENLDGFSKHFVTTGVEEELYLEQASQLVDHYWDVLASMNRSAKKEIPEWAEPLKGRR